MATAPTVGLGVRGSGELALGKASLQLGPTTNSQGCTACSMGVDRLTPRAGIRPSDVGKEACNPPKQSPIPRQQPPVIPGPQGFPTKLHHCTAPDPAYRLQAINSMFVINRPARYDHFNQTVDISPPQIFLAPVRATSMQILTRPIMAVLLI